MNKTCLLFVNGLFGEKNEWRARRPFPIDETTGINNVITLIVAGITRCL
ncbi:MAG: hypothetical protein P8N76_08125 [Pirellulaceae bacterium]|nr:hypothetical protein [Pirellulaceae bacterium]